MKKGFIVKGYHFKGFQRIKLIWLSAKSNLVSNFISCLKIYLFIRVKKIFSISRQQRMAKKRVKGDEGVTRCRSRTTSLGNFQGWIQGFIPQRFAMPLPLLLPWPIPSPIPLEKENSFLKTLLIDRIFRFITYA